MTDEHDGEGLLLRGAEGSEVGLSADREERAGVAAVHTPGPWLVHPDNPTEVIFGSEDGERTENGADIYWSHGGYYEAEANARLIAAAPDLLAVCIAYREECRRQGIKFGSINGDADAAIAKATDLSRPHLREGGSE